MRDNKQNIRYIGFASTPQGNRMLEFTFDTPGHDRASMTFEIAAMFFRGEDKILIQEAAGICYAKLKDLLSEPELKSSPKLIITSGDILRYRQITASRQRTRVVTT